MSKKRRSKKSLIPCPCFYYYLYEYRECKIVQEFIKCKYGEEELQKYFDAGSTPESELADCESQNYDMKKHSIRRKYWR